MTVLFGKASNTSSSSIIDSFSRQTRRSLTGQLKDSLACPIYEETKKKDIDHCISCGRNRTVRLHHL